jgi:hypothetical protein
MPDVSAETLVDDLLDGNDRCTLYRRPASARVPSQTHDALILDIDLRRNAISLLVVERISGDDQVAPHVWNGARQWHVLGSAQNGLVTYTRQELIQAVREVLPLAQRILDGGSVQREGGRDIGRLNADAQAAEGDLRRVLSHDGVLPAQPTYTTVATGDWLGADLSDWTYGMTLRDAVALVEEDAASRGVILVGDIEETLLRAAEKRLQQGEADLFDDAKLQELASVGVSEAEEALARRRASDLPAPSVSG